MSSNKKEKISVTQFFANNIDVPAQKPIINENLESGKQYKVKTVKHLLLN
jgi:hypothetical protein